MCQQTVTVGLSMNSCIQDSCIAFGHSRTIAVFIIGRLEPPESIRADIYESLKVIALSIWKVILVGLDLGIVEAFDHFGELVIRERNEKRLVAVLRCVGSDG